MDDEIPGRESFAFGPYIAQTVFRVIMKYRLLFSCAVSLLVLGGSLACGQTPILPGEPQADGQPVQESLGDAPGELKQDDKQPPVTALGTELDKWPLQSIDQISLDIRDKAKVVPRDRSGLLINESKSNWNDFYPTQKDFAWCPPDISYQPLYFQDIALERYGQIPYRCAGVQEALSGVHFFASAMTLPFQVLADPPCCCEYPLGYCRPGNPAPSTFQDCLFWVR
ncbi:MAG: hypothetical protein MK108_08815 [Mariniblastus sp.]|nr:hypothetical protein [Mariniblastus sp.]